MAVVIEHEDVRPRDLKARDFTKYKETTMSRVVGIGGIFMKAKDPEGMRAWYRKHLGLNIEDWGGTAFSWSHADGPGESGTTIWSIFEENSDYFEPSSARFMVNYIVSDLHAVLAELRSEGCEVDAKTEESEYGKFGWVMDPEGNRLELWEPPQPAEGSGGPAA
jgi:predicted enzyme related to lactoylglutathione lyase